MKKGSISFKMITHKKISFIGGDARMITAARILSADGYTVSAFFGETVGGELNKYSTLHDAMTDSDVLILPLPVSADGKLLNAPFLEDKIELLRLADDVPMGKTVIGGRIPDNIADILQKKNALVIDYFKSEAFQIENAYTTSEAALSIAMNNLRRNIRGAHFAITGYGRISRTLTELLLKLGGKVTVLARKESDLAWARLAGADTKRINAESIISLAHGYDIIFNTVPTWLFLEDFLLLVDDKTLIIDLASAPGGVDVSAAKRLSANVLWASSLPGKYAPDSAGELICSCIKDIVSEVGI